MTERSRQGEPAREGGPWLVGNPGALLRGSLPKFAPELNGRTPIAQASSPLRRPSVIGAAGNLQGRVALETPVGERVG